MDEKNSINNSKKTNIELGNGLQSCPELEACNLSIGERILSIQSEKQEFGIVKWIGRIPQICHEWVIGIEFDNEVGLGDGQFGGKQYFSAKRNHASFLPLTQIISEELLKKYQLGISSENENKISITHYETSKSQEKCQYFIVDVYIKNHPFDNEQKSFFLASDMTIHQIQSMVEKECGYRIDLLSLTFEKSVSNQENNMFINENKEAFRVFDVADEVEPKSAQISEPLRSPKTCTVANSNCKVAQNIDQLMLDISKDSTLTNPIYNHSNKSQSMNSLSQSTDNKSGFLKRKLVTDVDETRASKSRNIESKEETNGNFNYTDLINLGNCPLVENKEQFLCQICNICIEVGKGVVLQECLHTFCKFCLVNTVTVSKDYFIKCPFKSTEYSCESQLQEREIKALVPPDIFDQYLQRSAAVAEGLTEHSFHCKTPDCIGWCIFEDDVNNFFCPVCERINCLICRAIHEGFSCQQYQNKLSNSNKNLEVETESSHEQQINAEIIEKKNDINLMDVINMPIVPNSVPFECPVCLTVIDTKQGIVLQDCLHTFCRECLVNTIKFSEDIVIKCPYSDELYSCNSHLQDREIKALASLEDYDKYLLKSVLVAESQAQNSFHCKTPDCAGWCLYEDDVNNFVCPVCKKDNCLICQAIHENLDCKKYQEQEFWSSSNPNVEKTQKYLKKMFDKGNAMNCPTCNIVIQKKSGCDWILCPMCKLEICWVTKGPRWGPKGHGDISGGCKCRFPKICHPKCGNCH